MQFCVIPRHYAASILIFLSTAMDGATNCFKSIEINSKHSSADYTL